ncbi:MAG: universal stress protein [Acidimicrobiia bacterium]|jgi:nucleotide-binding universal stress UspA family protein
MTTVLAAIDDSNAADTVLATAAALARLTGARVKALHVREDGVERARAVTEAAELSLVEVAGDVVEQIATAAADPDVQVVVVGARRHPEGARPAGHVAFALLRRVRTPLVVVPPDTESPATLERVLVPLDGTMRTARRAHAVIDLAATAGLDVIVFHCFDVDRLPMFTDQPQHETRAFEHEFLARYAPDTPARLELRVGTPADEVLAAAQALDVDLVAIAWAQILEPGRARIVRELLARSRVPLLLLPVDHEDSDSL